MNGTPIQVPLRQLRPTQVSVGMRAVATKRQRILLRLEDPDRFERYLGSRVIPAVRGPGKQLFIVDHHHLTVALMSCGIEHAFATVLKDLSGIPRDAFWSQMAAEGFAYPFDEYGDPIPLSAIPTSMSALRADSFRDLAWSVREAGGFAKCETKYSEFRWANFFRTSIDPRMVERDYERAVSCAMKLARSSNASALPGYVAAKRVA